MPSLWSWDGLRSTFSMVLGSSDLSESPVQEAPFHSNHSKERKPIHTLKQSEQKRIRRAQKRNKVQNQKAAAKANSRKRGVDPAICGSTEFTSTNSIVQALAQDVDGDGIADVITLNANGGEAYLSTDGFTPTLISSSQNFNNPAALGSLAASTKETLWGNPWQSPVPGQAWGETRILSNTALAAPSVDLEASSTAVFGTAIGDGLGGSVAAVALSNGNAFRVISQSGSDTAILQYNGSEVTIIPSSPLASGINFGSKVIIVETGDTPDEYWVGVSVTLRRGITIPSGFENKVLLFKVSPETSFANLTEADAYASVSFPSGVYGGENVLIAEGSIFTTSDLGVKHFPLSRINPGTQNITEAHLAANTISPSNTASTELGELNMSVSSSYYANGTAIALSSRNATGGKTYLANIDLAAISATTELASLSSGIDSSPNGGWINNPDGNGVGFGVLTKDESNKDVIYVFAQGTNKFDKVPESSNFFQVNTENATYNEDDTISFSANVDSSEASVSVTTALINATANEGEYIKFTVPDGFPSVGVSSTGSVDINPVVGGTEYVIKDGGSVVLEASPVEVNAVLANITAGAASDKAPAFSAEFTLHDAATCDKVRTIDITGTSVADAPRVVANYQYSIETAGDTRVEFNVTNPFETVDAGDSVRVTLEGLPGDCVYTLVNNGTSTEPGAQVGMGSCYLETSSEGAYELALSAVGTSVLSGLETTAADLLTFLVQARQEELPPAEEDPFAFLTSPAFMVSTALTLVGMIGTALKIHASIKAQHSNNMTRLTTTDRNWTDIQQQFAQEFSIYFNAGKLTVLTDSRLFQIAKFLSDKICEDQNISDEDLRESLNTFVNDELNLDSRSWKVPMKDLRDKLKYFPAKEEAKIIAEKLAGNDALEDGFIDTVQSFLLYLASKGTQPIEIKKIIQFFDEETLKARTGCCKARRNVSITEYVKDLFYKRFPYSSSEAGCNGTFRLFCPKRPDMETQFHKAWTAVAERLVEKLADYHILNSATVGKGKANRRTMSLEDAQSMRSDVFGPDSKENRSYENNIPLENISPTAAQVFS